MKKTMIKTSFSKWRDAGLDTLGHTVDIAMTGNPNFLTLAPEVAAVHDAYGIYSVALAAVPTGSREDRAKKDAARVMLLKALRVLAIKINIEADGDEAKLQTTGFPLVAQVTRRGKLPQAGGLTASPDPGHGNMKLEVDPVDGAKSYLFQCTKAPVTEASVWINSPSSKATAHVHDLEPRVEYAFRVAAIGSDPEYLFSEVVFAYTV